jgi:hypothetical protein
MNGEVGVVNVPEVVEGHEWALPTNDDDFEVFDSLGAQPLAGSWQPIPMELLHMDTDGIPLHPADLPWLGSQVLILKPRAIDALGETLERYGELLPLRCDETDLAVFHCWNLLDALDEDQSKIVRFASSGRIMVIEEHVLRPAVVGDADVFKLSAMPRGSLYLSERFAELVREHRLTGLDFRPVWTSGN